MNKVAFDLIYVRPFFRAFFSFVHAMYKCPIFGAVLFYWFMLWVYCKLFFHANWFLSENVGPTFVSIFFVCEPMVRKGKPLQFSILLEFFHTLMRTITHFLWVFKFDRHVLKSSIIRFHWSHLYPYLELRTFYTLCFLMYWTKL